MSGCYQLAYLIGFTPWEQEAPKIISSVELAERACRIERTPAPSSPTASYGTDGDR